MDEEKPLRVHKHLLGERSESLKADVDNTKGGYLDWAQFGLELQVASRYVNFLYGQPMWAYSPGANIYSDWHALNELYQFSTSKGDFDAADACVDGMRDILQNWRDDLEDDPFDPVDLDFEAPDGRLIADYMAHRSCDIRK